jgi:ABC-type microcin C transport system permease subunit YejB
MCVTLFVAFYTITLIIFGGGAYYEALPYNKSNSKTFSVLQKFDNLITARVHTHAHAGVQSYCGLKSLVLKFHNMLIYVV